MNVVLNVEFSQHNELDEEVEESSPIEANVCRRCGAVTEKKMLCQMMTNNRLSLVLLPEDQKKITQPKPKPQASIDYELEEKFRNQSKPQASIDDEIERRKEKFKNHTNELNEHRVCR